MELVPVGILGATGLVGQRFISLLQEHPKFYIKVLGASEKSAAKEYQHAVSYWGLESSMPDKIKDIPVVECKVDNFGGCKVIFSALQSDVASIIEPQFANEGFPVFSNASSFRMAPNVPLVVPLVNPEHLERSILDGQNCRGYIITNANCSTTGLAVAVKPLMDAFMVESVLVHTMQAVSGSGYPGISSISILDNVVPFIKGEEEKLESELLKILSSWDEKNSRWVSPELKISSSCNRVPVVDGHLMNVSVRLRNPPKTIEEIEKVFDEYSTKTCNSGPIIKVFRGNEFNDRPQPRLDRMNGKGYQVSVGRMRRCNVLDFKFTCLVHNTILGAAGSSILNAEIALAKGLIKLQ